MKLGFRSRSLAVLGIVASAFALVIPMRVAAAATVEPAGFEYFHTYAENEQVIDDAVAAHPAIAMKFSIGQSYEGRQIWGIKISDNVAVDENEPEVLIHGLTHARERASNEEALSLIQLLTGSYATTLGSRQSSTAARSGLCPCSIRTVPSTTCPAATGISGARTASPFPTQARSVST